MRRIVLGILGAAAFTLGAVAAQQRDPANPWPGHAEPTPGWHCVPARNAKEVTTNEHACACLGMILEALCGETPEETRARQETAKCKSYCWATGHCLCDRQCPKDS